VRKLAPGTEITVTVTGSPAATRYFLLADESDLTVLNLTDPTLTAHARDALRAMASHHPEYFVEGQKGKVSAFRFSPASVRGFSGEDVLVGPDGAFVAGHKVADLGQIIERFASTDLLSVVETKHGPSTGAWIAIVSGVVAGVIVLMMLSAFCGHAGC
jgi:hypothetical protein